LTIKVLKNQLVVVTDKDGTSISLSDDSKLVKENAHNILDWECIMKERHNNLKDLLQNLLDTEETFNKYYMGNIRDYDMLEMMKRYFTDEQLSVIGIHNIAARICCAPDCKICSKGSSNPQSVWKRLKEGLKDILKILKDMNMIYQQNGKLFLY